jgi:acyl carrier protein
MVTVMDAQNIKNVVLNLLNKIAPEADLDTLAPDLRFRDQFDFDSIDCLNLMNSLEKELKITIPEVDYPRLASLNGCIDYLMK